MNKVVTVVFNIVATLLQTIFDFLTSLFPAERKTEFDADFMPSGEVLSSFNKGFCLDGRKSLTISDSFKNVLITGGTGNFKSSGILIPSILKMRGHSSFVINDPAGELLLKTSGALLEAGYTIKTLNYNSPYLSEGYNPLLRARLTTSGIQKIAKMVVTNSLGQGGNDPFWNLSAVNLIGLCAQYTVNHTPKECHSLFNVYHLISTLLYAPDKVDKLFVKANDPTLLSEYKAFVSYGDKTLSSIVATCRSALQIFATDPSVALVTCYDTISFSEFREKKVALFINNSVTDMKYYSVITSIFLEQFFAEVLSHKPGKQDLPIFFLIDEASSLCFNSLQITIANIRKSASGILQIYQSPSQIIDLYNQSVAKSITENSYARVYMAGVPIQVAQELETTLGKFEYKDENNVRHLRPLMTANEIRESEDSIILVGNHRAIKTKTVPYFKQFRLSRLTQLPPYKPNHTLPFEIPPRIQID